MKNGKKPTLKQKEIIASKNLNVANWLVIKNLEGQLHVVHKHSGKARVIKYDQPQHLCPECGQANNYEVPGMCLECYKNKKRGSDKRKAGQAKQKAKPKNKKPSTGELRRALNVY